ncbi:MULTISPECIES: dihydrolipoamide acetyltransferase family protein [unclassified Rhizobium]|uniref:dihydrolipoamide acetyltransferase family protein n=1 Tax=unclassified Rhizobium TaxID=2613769 RepID=UPI001ADC454C|nr:MULTISPECIES: dihydrolipoamide acetyltransferase family protein [unclassified Rhizobium]MBO9100605.1 2-oxo acid dehydrogenase subunit E2 [Rhizobium sp. L58/93]MBO9136033.1 2-oxo acid dehydrogenase subunit E2 [Rhizobium sp. B209b/85]MBO9171344.1 2-oxo acid dehydrogenase subunit E2 [Rhizobium sp. L245/93]MBO9187211.1 2-oxo acid dehydrogenase subunit E2 [Rhizobium sp. E27B/91]QXZ87895.1 2-oxo acid dehydrogenase subunit E2 [Rhizobium sp. K1/93]
MAIEVILPKVDMDMATGRISKWFFESGATVKKGDVLFEIETDKAAMEIDAPASGILRDVVGAEGMDIAVGAPVAWIYEEGEAYSPGSSAAPAAPPAINAEAVPEQTASVEAAASPVVAGEGIRATPLARRLARNAGIDISRITGSGPNGRVTRADVEGYAPPVQQEEAVAAPSGAQKPVVAGPSSEQTRKLFAEGSYDLVAHSNMRRTIARRLVEAKSTVPHFYLTIDCNIDALLKLRAEVNSSTLPIGGKPANKLSVNDMVIKAYAMALAAVPDANVSWTDDSLIVHRHVDIGVAVSVPGGLITPIVRNAETKTLSVISTEMKDLGARAKEGKLKPEEYQGGTAAISNLGMFGIREFAAIVNPPHATILAVGAGERRAVISGEAVVPATLMTVTLSTDHRAVDGALAAELIGAFRTYIETPMAMII